jgi:photosystem II PsbJ protein|uniref:Photosystem II protein J n=1 Tax=Populus trichocarpa TaxID=3694 RepID=A0A3N7F9H7_POPTR
MADTTGRIPFWIIGTVTGILVIGLIGISFMAPISAWVHPCSNRMN